jgi:hypothetical protein
MSGLSKSVVIDYLVLDCAMDAIDEAVKLKKLKARRVGRAKKSYHK